MKLETNNEAPAKFAIALLVGAVVVMALPILNGGPAIYFDTPAYLKPAFKVGALFWPESNVEIATAQPEQQVTTSFSESVKIVTSGRSIYYGLFLYVGWLTTLWLPVAVQAVVFSWLVLLLFKFASPPAWRYKAIGTLFFVSIFSSASFFTGLLMPDVWSGIMILTLALLWAYSDQLSIWSKLTMLAILVFSSLAHSSHYVLLGAVTVFFVILWVLGLDRHVSLIRKITLPVIALALGLAGMVAYSLAVKVVYGAKLMHRPFLTAHLTDMGPGTRYLQQTCPESGFALCEFKDKLPVDWIDFLFDPSPETGVFGAIPIEEQWVIAEEQMPFVLQTLAAEPVATIVGFLNDGVTQLWTLSMAHVALSQRNEAYLQKHAQPALIERIKETRVYHNPGLSRLVERNIEIFAVLSVLILSAWLIMRLGRSNASDPEAAARDNVIIILIAGVVLNALICGILASPYGRFQARIVWILPLIASLILVSQPQVSLSLWRNQSDSKKLGSS